MPINVQNSLKIKLNNNISIESGDDNTELTIKLLQPRDARDADEPVASLDESDVLDLIEALQSWLDER